MLLSLKLRLGPQPALNLGGHEQPALTSINGSVIELAAWTTRSIPKAEQAVGGRSHYSPKPIERLLSQYVPKRHKVSSKLFASRHLLPILLINFDVMYRELSKEAHNHFE